MDKKKGDESFETQEFHGAAPDINALIAAREK